MLVAVGTKNPAKLEGVKRVFADFFPDVRFQSLDTSSVTNAQPMGMDQIIEGAVKRARFAISKTRARFGVGVEAGIFPLSGRLGHMDHQEAVIMNRRGKYSLGSSAGFMLPPRWMRRMVKEGNELEHYAVEMTGVPAVGDKEGLVYHLTKGRISRADLTEQCVRTALVPWLHAELYGF
jgi:inosine/xanthosine triphosphatase